LGSRWWCCRVSRGCSCVDVDAGRPSDIQPWGLREVVHDERRGLLGRQLALATASSGREPTPSAMRYPGAAVRGARPSNSPTCGMPRSVRSFIGQSASNVVDAQVSRFPAVLRPVDQIRHHRERQPPDQAGVRVEAARDTGSSTSSWALAYTEFRNAMSAYGVSWAKSGLR
jgi:hypothetical protein